MEGILAKALNAAQTSSLAFCKFITANDTGSTGGHQAGFHVHKNAWSLFFESPGERGSNKDILVTIRWQDDFETTSRFIYYGVGTRNEYRLTRFGRGFPFLEDEHVGDLLILCKRSDQHFEAFVLSTEEQMEEFCASLGISTNETNRLIPKIKIYNSEDELIRCFRSFIGSLQVGFPSTVEMATRARNCYNSAFSIVNRQIRQSPDEIILRWIDAEYELFRLLEENRYQERIHTPFESVAELINTANTLLNRRKSRAGKSLEHHLGEIFNTFELSFENQPTTEGNKKPDFIFPNSEAYFNPSFDSTRLFLLAAKTTCKDRWRQILSEGDRVSTKHLFTTQQGISRNQLDEMYTAGVRLVVPRPIISCYPEIYRGRILPLDSFLGILAASQSSLR